MSTVISTEPVMATPPRRVGVEEFLKLPDEGRGYELVDGQLKERIVSAKSSRVGLEVGWFINSYCRTRQPAWIFGSDASFRCFLEHPDRIRRADVAVIVAQRMSPEEYESSNTITICPDLVVEVISPNDLASEVIRKRMEWLDAGVQMVWIVYPEDQSVYAYQTGARPVVYTAEDVLPGEPVLPGFTVPVADLFRLPMVS